jgi:hypothetical protein
MHHHLRLKDRPNFTQIGIFCLKILVPSGNPDRNDLTEKLCQGQTFVETHVGNLASHLGKSQMHVGDSVLARIEDRGFESRQ